MAHNPTWILVMSGTRARVLRGFGHEDGEPPGELVLRSEHRRLREIMADKPGRSQACAGDGRRSAMEYASDPLREDERDLLRRVLDLLQAHRRAGDFRHLALYAEPQMLGLFRQMAPPALAEAVVSEHSKNLIHLEPRELAARVAEDLGRP